MAAWASAALLLLLTGCGESNEKLMAAAEQRVAAGDHRGAVVQLMHLLQQDPSSTRARFLLGRSLFETSDLIGAGVELQKALDAGHPADEIVPMLAKCVLATGGPDRVVERFAKTKLGSPAAVADLQLTLATAYGRKGKMAEAQASVDAALAAQPDSTPARLMQVRMQAAAGKLPDALASLEQLIAKDPKSATAQQLRGDVLRVSGAVDGAMKAYQQAVALDGKDVLARGGIIEILMTRRDFSGAKEQVLELEKIAPKHSRTMLYIALLALEKGEYQKATEIAQILIKDNPDSPAFFQLAGAVELRKGSLAQAESYLNKALYLDAKQTRARLMLVQVLQLQGATSRAMQLLQPMLNSSAPDWESLTLAGRAALTAGDSKSAEGFFNRAVALRPDDASSRISLAVARLARNNSEAELGVLNQVAAQESGPTADFALIAALLRARQLDKALAATERLAAKPGMKSIALHLQGRVQLERNDVPRAREAFEASLKNQPTYFPAASALAALDLQERKPDAARKRFETVLEAAPSNLDARMALVGLRANAGAGKDELAQALQTAIKFNTTAAQPRVALIKLELDRSQAKAAEAAAMDAIAAIPDNAELIDLLGQAQLRLGEYSQARANFGKLANLLPDSVLPFLRLAQADLAENQPQAAIVNIRKALPLDPSSLLLRNLLAAAQIAAGKPQDALATARLMQGEAKNAAAGWMVEGDVQVILRKWKAAVEAYRHSIEKEETTEAAIKLRTALVGARGDNVAWERSWLAKHPGDSGFMSHLAGAELDAEHFDAAEQLYRRVVEIDAKNAVAWNNLAWLAGRAKRPEALQYVQTARQLLPKEAMFVDTEADIYAMRGDLTKAVAAQEQAVAMAPNKPILHLRLATLYLQVDKKAQAKKELTGLAELGDKFPKAAEVKALLAKL